MEPWVFLLVVLAIAAVAAAQWWWKQRRREEWRKMARVHGLEFSRHDPFDLLWLPFRLLGKGDGRGVEHVAWGTYGGREVKAFDYWYYDESNDSDGHRSRSYNHFTCVVSDLPSDLQRLTVRPEGILSRLADHVGFRDIELESEEFNRAFQVEAEDRRFATYLLDARMMRWLLYAEGSWRYEISANHLLLVSGRVWPNKVPELIGAHKGFADHIPDVVWDVYGARGSAG